MNGEHDGVRGEKRREKREELCDKLPGSRSSGLELGQEPKSEIHERWPMTSVLEF